MPKLTGTKKDRARQLRERIDPDYLFNNTSVFSQGIGMPPFDPYTIDQIKASYALYFYSWIKEDLEQLLNL